MRWLGHVYRIPMSKAVRKVLTGDVEARRGRGRPRKKSFVRVLLSYEEFSRQFEIKSNGKFNVLKYSKDGRIKTIRTTEKKLRTEIDRKYTRKGRRERPMIVVEILKKP